MSRVPRLVFITALAFGALFVAVDGVLLGLRLTWPSAQVVAGGNGLAAVQIAGIGEHVTSVRAAVPSGKQVKVVYRNGAIVPEVKLRGGRQLHVEATVTRSKWLG